MAGHVLLDPWSEKYLGPKPIKVAQRKLTYPIQMELFPRTIHLGSGKEYKRDNKYIGSFYEILAQGIFGGEWRGVRHSASENGDWSLLPDVVTNKEVMDSKAVSWDESLKIGDFQFDKYLVQQCTSEFLSSRKIFIPMFKYGLRHPWTLFDTFRENQLENIVRELAGKTAFMLFIPFSLAYKIHHPEAPSRFISRYDGERYDNMTRFSSRGIKLMLENPKECLEGLNVNPEDYIIERARLPDGMKMNQFSIRPFPMVLLQDKNYDGWLANFIEGNQERVRQLLDEKRTRDQYRQREQEEEMRAEGCSDVDLEDEEKKEREESLDDVDLPF
jgi:hypothetical protein